MLQTHFRLKDLHAGGSGLREHLRANRICHSRAIAGILHGWLSGGPHIIFNNVRNVQETGTAAWLPH